VDSLEREIAMAEEELKRNKRRGGKGVRA